MNKVSKTKQKKSPFISPENIYADTHVGLVRDHNEDSFVYYTNLPSSQCLAALADGIGGHESGDIASNLCLQMLASTFRKLKKCHKWKSGDWGGALKDRIIKANDVIFGLNEKYEIQHPMGTTIVAGVFLEDSVVIAHAGDSRCYRVRKGELKRLTEDHSFVAELVKKNIINEEEAQFHPFAHIISRSVGPLDNMEPELSTFDKKPGDRYMFCSDGLTNHVDDGKIKKMLSEAETPAAAVKKLLHTALQGGGEDNVTVLCVFA